MKIVVIGAGKSGVYAAVLAKNKGNDVFLTESSNSLEIKEMLPLLQGKGIPYETDGHSFKRLEGVDLVILSPGIPLNSMIVQETKRRGIPIIGEMEFAYTQSPMAKVVAITGTNGKSTTTALTGHMLENAGFNVVTGGNLGMPYSQLLIENPNPDYAVLEISCFQLETIKSFRPYIAAFLNFTEDHLDRYADLKEYFFNKKRVFENQLDSDFAVLNFDDPVIKEISKDVKSKVYYFSLSSFLKKGTFLSNEEILFSDNKMEKILERKDIQLIGLHNVQNVLVAVTIGKLLYLENEKIKEGIETFKSLAHRIELVRTVDGVIYVNDSKSTTPDSTIKALEAFKEKIVLIAGGSSKNNDFKELARLFSRKLRKLIILGETASEIAEASTVEGFTNFTFAVTLEEAVNLARKEAHAGDIVLLSPACASFDMFKDFEDRGEQFKIIVNNL